MPDAKPKRQYQFSSKERAKIAARTAERVKTKKVRRKESRRLAKERAKERESEDVDRLKLKTTASRQLAKQINGESSKIKGYVATTDQIEVAGKTFEHIVEDDEDIVFKPNVGPQTDFLAASETEVLYGGAAGGGKSYAMLVDPLRYFHRSGARSLLVRKTLFELTELINISKNLYPKAFPGAKWSDQNKAWTFPSGATHTFSFIDTDKDVERFQGQSFSWIGIDEITHYQTPYVWNTLRSRLRRTDMEIIPYMRCTANPGGLGGWWVKKMFLDPTGWQVGDDAPEPFWGTDIETGETLVFPQHKKIDEDLWGTPTIKRRFIPAKLTDNPYLMQSMEYLSMLASLPQTQRMRLLDGDWDVSDDCAFPEFYKPVHVIPQFTPPSDWPRFRACDYGYVAPTAVIWFTIDYDGTLIAYRELYEKKLDAAQLAEKIHEIEADEPPGIIGILDSESWSRRGQIAPSVAQEMINRGIKWQKADKGPGSRVNGKIEIHRLFRVDPETGKPKVQITEACRNLIRTFPMLPLDPNNPEDVDTKFAEDHLYDAFRYGCTSRHVKAPRYALEKMFYTENTYQPADSVFGY